ncbi:MAG: hypothetical protein ACK4JA_15110, partial [Parazoarcus communis]
RVSSLGRGAAVVRNRGGDAFPLQPLSTGVAGAAGTAVPGAFRAIAAWLCGIQFNLVAVVANTATACPALAGWTAPQFCDEPHGVGRLGLGRAC